MDLYGILLGWSESCEIHPTRRNFNDLQASLWLVLRKQRASSYKFLTGMYINKGVNSNP
jgi:hypothetical protein